MADETKEELRRRLADARERGGSVCLTHAHTAAILARLDAADPIRKLWPEVVEALERIRIHPNAHFNVAEAKHGAPTIAELADALLTRIRAITPEGDDQP